MSRTSLIPWISMSLDWRQQYSRQITQFLASRPVIRASGAINTKVVRLRNALRGNELPTYLPEDPCLEWFGLEDGSEALHPYFQPPGYLTWNAALVRTLTYAVKYAEAPEGELPTLQQLTHGRIPWRDMDFSLRAHYAPAIRDFLVGHRLHTPTRQETNAMHYLRREAPWHTFTPHTVIPAPIDLAFGVTADGELWFDANKAALPRTVALIRILQCIIK